MSGFRIIRNYLFASRKAGIEKINQKHATGFVLPTNPYHLELHHVIKSNT